MSEWVTGRKDRGLSARDHYFLDPTSLSLTTLASLDVEERNESRESGGKVIRNPAGRVYTLPPRPVNRFHVDHSPSHSVLVSAHYVPLTSSIMREASV